MVTRRASTFALDVIRTAQERTYDVALLFCRDQDLSEVADELRLISGQQKRWIKIASAYPYSPAVKGAVGIQRTDWVRIDRAEYDRCIDHRDYRPKPAAANNPPIGGKPSASGKRT